MKHGVLSYLSPFNPVGSMYEKRNHHALVIAKLLTPSMTYSVIGDEKDDRVFKLPFLF